MVRRSLLTLTAALAAVFHLNLPAGALASPVLVDGTVMVIAGNRFPGPHLSPPQPGRGMTVVAIAGRVSPAQPGQPFLPAAALRAPIIGRARCNAQGRFRLSLPQSRTSSSASDPPLTLLLQVPGGYYLNHFDGEGRFASIRIPRPPDQPPILLRDDRGALH
ncbi:MAG: hypothetical protein ACKOCM_12065 [Cyanobacteriota bacterium]